MIDLQPFTTEREWTADGITILVASVSVPQPVSAKDNVCRRIRRYYRLLCRTYLRYCEKMLLPQAVSAYRAALSSSTPLPLFRAELDYRVTYHASGLLSLYTESRESALSGRPLITRRSDTWDLRSGYPIPLSDFFPPHSPWKKQLLSHAAAEIEKQERAGTARYHEGWLKLLRRHFNPENYYLTEDGLVFFFPMFSIAPSAEGIPAFFLSFQETECRILPEQAQKNGNDL